eukprot:scaffold70763_cov32-Tisochrysis_lutea.AAC.6
MDDPAIANGHEQSTSGLRSKRQEEARRRQRESVRADGRRASGRTAHNRCRKRGAAKCISPQMGYAASRLLGARTIPA